MSNADQPTMREQVSSDAFLGLTSAFRDREGKQYIALIRDANRSDEIVQIESHAKERMAITCPHILRCLDYQTTLLASETRQFKFIYQHPGSPLSMLRRVKNPGGEVLESLMKAGLEALSYLEESMHTYHGMISPDCLYLSEDGKWRLALHPWNEETPENKLLDKAILDLPIYVSPEIFAQIAARNYSFRSNGIKSDVFALGLCVLEFGIEEPIESIYNRTSADQKSLIWFVKKFERKFSSYPALCRAVAMTLEWFEEFRPSPREVLEVLSSAPPSAPTPSTVSTPPASPSASPKPNQIDSQTQRVTYHSGRSVPPSTGFNNSQLYQPRFQTVASAQQNSGHLRYGVAPRVASGSASALPSRREGESPRVQTYSSLSSRNNTSTVTRQYSYNYNQNEPFAFTSVSRDCNDPFTFTSVPQSVKEPYISDFNPISTPSYVPTSVPQSIKEPYILDFNPSSTPSYVPTTVPPPTPTNVPQNFYPYSQGSNQINPPYSYDRKVRQDYSSSTRNFVSSPAQTSSNWTSASQPPSPIFTSSQPPSAHSPFTQDYRTVHLPLGPTRTGVYKVVGNEVYDEVIESTEEIREGQKYIIRKPVWVQRSSS